MDLKQIEILLQKYYNGETSIEEEGQLTDFFKHNDVPDHLKPDQDIFDYYSFERKENKIKDSGLEQQLVNMIDGLSDEKNQATTKKRYLYALASIAAGILLFFGVYSIFINKNPVDQSVAEFNDTFDNPQLAYNETKKILLYVSGKFNEGTSELENISKINNAMNELGKVSKLNRGIEELSIITKFRETQELITKKTK